MSADDASGPVLLFDGHCNLCNHWVDFVLRRERLGGGSTIRFGSLQSESGTRLAAEHGIDAGNLSSLVWVEDGVAYQRSSAVLRVLGRMKAPWRWARVTWIVPRFFRDWVYGLVARSRYRLFGKSDVCRIPTPEERSRFLP